MPQRLAALAGRIDDDIQTLDDVPLADHFLDGLRTEAAIEFFVALGRGRDDGFAGH
jgi:hypothetical protein